MREEPDITELKKKLREKRKASKSKEPVAPKEETVEREKLEKRETTEESDVAIQENQLIDEPVIERYGEDDIESPEEFKQKDKRTEKPDSKVKVKKSKKKPRVKRKKLNINYLKVSLVLLTVLVIFFALYYLIGNKSDVKEIEIVGAEHLSTDEILSRSEIAKGDKMYLANLGKAEKNIALLPIVESIDVSRDFPNKIVMKVKERDVVAYVESKGKYYPVLESEQVLRGFDMVPTDAPIIHFFDGVEFEGIVKSLNQMNAQILSMISEIFYRPNKETNSRIQIYMNDGQEIIGDLHTIGDKINYYAGMKEEIGDKKGLIDLEVSNTFLPYNSGEATRIKQNIHNIPTQAPYLEDIEASLDRMKRSLEALKKEDEK